jgi:ribosome-binding factor A
MHRSERIAEVLHEEIAEIVGYELEDPRLVSATVTEVKVSENLRDAKVFVFVRVDDKEIKEAMDALHHAATFVRRQLALNLDLRHVPQIHFARDTVEENAARIEELLEDIK